MSAKVLFVMMAYNTEKYIKKAVTSVLNQTEKDIKMIVRNNGSTDKTGEILEEIAKEDQRLLVLNNMVNGKGDNGETFYDKSWWLGEDDIEAEYISIIDSDDYIAEDFVEKTYKRAKENNADIVATGNFFVDESYKIVGKRDPMDLVTDNMADIDKDYARIYNCFRTWWGKLLKKEFFVDNYTEAWKPEPPMDRFMDTIVMFKYLRKCKKLVTFEDNLYYMLLRKTSTYSTMSFAYSIHIDACALYNHNMSFLNKFNIANEKNRTFVEKLHLGYILENMEKEIYNKNSSKTHKFLILQRVFRDMICKNYMNKLMEEIGVYIYKFVTEVTKFDEDDFNDNQFFVVRLKKYFDMEQRDNPINFLVLLGCLSDLENPLKFGSRLMKMYKGSLSKGCKELLKYPYISWNEFFYKPLNVVELSNNIDRDAEVIAKEEELIVAWENQDFEKACDLTDEITERCLFSFVAIYYRIKLALLIEDYDFAGLLYYTARSIWGNDPDLMALVEE